AAALAARRDRDAHAQQPGLLLHQARGSVARDPRGPAAAAATCPRRAARHAGDRAADVSGAPELNPPQRPSRTVNARRELQSFGPTMAVASSPFRRDELRAFLRSRRARLSPADVGLPEDGGRRRTPGLRREELAALAGVGVSWYTWLEQGRDINPSPEVLDALAQTLRLDAAERRTLFALARTELPLADDAAAADRQSGDPDPRQLIALVDSMNPNPAYLLGPMTRILAWNRAASVVLGSPDHLPPDRRYLLWWLLVEPGQGAMTPQREATARNTLARFRAEYAQHA